MAEITRLINMLQKSAAENNEYKTFVTSSPGRPLDCGPSPPTPLDHYKDFKAAPSPLLKTLQVSVPKPLCSPKPVQDLNKGVNHIICSVKTVLPTEVKGPRSPSHVRETLNDVAVATCKRIFKAASNPQKLYNLSLSLKKDTATSPKMAGRFPSLTTSNLPPASATETSATASPARGTAMLNSIFKSVRVPEFRFKWHFWAEKGQQSAPSSKDKSTTAAAEEFASRPKPLGDQIISVKEFYQHFNNIPVESLKLRDSIHLFHLGVKPLWEDPRNARGGAYYFRISKDVAAQFWHEICLLAVGDVLQGAVETKRESFNDDICGISYSVRWNAVQIAIWNRDADNEAGKEKLLAVILEKLSDELKPKKDSYWYKAHSDHKGFAGSGS